MSETRIEAQTTEHDVAIAEAQAEAVVAVAEAQAEAATEIAATEAESARAYQAELERCQTLLASLSSELSALRSDHERQATEHAQMLADHREMIDKLHSSIPPQPEPPPANPANLENGPSEGEVTVPEEAPAEQPEEPKPPERRRAHRWI